MKKIKKPRIKNGLEFYESEFNELCTSQHIARYKTLVEKSLQNGVVEHINRTLLKRVQCMLSNANLWHRRDFWAETISIACYLVDWAHTLPLILKF